MIYSTDIAPVDFLEKLRRSFGEKPTWSLRRTEGYGGTPWQTIDQALAPWHEALPFTAKSTITQPGSLPSLSGTLHTQASQPRTLPSSHIRPSSSLEKPDFSALPISPEYEK